MEIIPSDEVPIEPGKSSVPIHDGRQHHYSGALSRLRRLHQDDRQLFLEPKLDAKPKGSR